MPKELELIYLDQERQVQLHLRRDGDCRVAPAVSFDIPLESSENPDIGWYFQEYLDDPSDTTKSRAEGVESRLRNTGHRLFEVVFQSNQEAKDIYTAVCADDLNDYQLVVTSSSPSFLSQPWELLHEPEGGFLVPRLASLVRRSSAGTPPQFAGDLTTEQLNVLLVAPIPQAVGASTQQEAPAASLTEKLPIRGFGSLAMESLDVLDSLKVQVELDYLRPATVAALSEHLSQHPGHYHLVHLDGLVSSDPESLEFESDGDGASSVPASQIAEILSSAKVPVVLLTSWSTDTVSMLQTWPAAADRLAQAGVPYVVSVPFPLSTSAKELFVRSFYEALIQGKDIPSTVALARRALMANPHRVTPLGKAVFWDWIGPVVYQSQTYAPSPIDAEEAAPLAPSALPPQEEQQRAEEQLPHPGAYGLVGRRSELRHLEELFQQNPVVLLAGDAGVGKTELALGLARWLQNTSARSGGVFYSTFEVGAGLERIIHETGTGVSGLQFPDMSAQQQRRWLVDYLRERPSLLIWDGVQNISRPERQGSGLLDESEQSDLDSFLAEIAEAGQSWVLLVSRRREEAWLTTPHKVYELAGLERHDGLELGGKILEKAGVFDSVQGPQAEGRLGTDYLNLMNLINQNPLALQIALPLLKELPASVVSGEVEKRLSELAPNDQEESRDSCLTAVMDYSFSRMPRRSRIHLPFMSLFQNRAMMDILTHITQERVYRSVMGEELGWGACRTLMRSSRDAGFLEPVTPSVYQIHSALPWFYGRQLHRQVRSAGIARLEQEFVRVYADTADYFLESLNENPDSGATAILAEEGNLTQALGLALEAQQWHNAQLLVQPLAQVYRMQKRYSELRRLRQRLLDIVGADAQDAEAKGAIELWVFLLGTESSQATDLLELDRAEELSQQLMTYLTSQPNGESDPRTASIYHQMGVIDQHRRRLDGAEEWFLKSLAIIEDLDDPDLVAAVADDYHCLGQVRQTQRRYGEAKEFFSKGLDIHQRLQDEEEMVRDYRALGVASQYRFEYDEAESWFHRARDIIETNRDEETAVHIYHELATVFHARYQYDEAEDWYRQALDLSFQLGMEEQMAVEFHHLGLLAQNREMIFEDAEKWYLLALERYQKLGNRVGEGDEARQLGVLFHQQNRLDEAEEWYKRAGEIFQETEDPYRAARTYGQLGMVAEERNDLTSALEWVARTHQLAAGHNLALLEQVKTHLARLRDKYGEDDFVQWWRGFTGGDPPTDLDAATEPTG